MKKEHLLKRDFNYYNLSLLSFLKESHPELMNDHKFIKDRAEQAAEAYSNAIKNNLHHDVANETANDILFFGLHFSKYDTIKNILWDEFSTEIAEDKVESNALELLPLCEEIFANYKLTDDFADSRDYDLLRTELIGQISIIFESVESR